MLVFDESDILIERFPKQLRTLMACYTDMLKICTEQTVAQFVLFSSQWTTKLKYFIQKFIPYPAYVFDNKLESSYFGQTQHVLEECDEDSSKIKKIHSILKQACRLNKNTVLFTSSDSVSRKLNDILTIKLGYTNVCLALDFMNEHELSCLQNKWSQWDSIDKTNLIEKKLNLNLILVCTEHSIRFINISNAKCIINWDFPSSRSVFANRLWLMRAHFDGNKKVERIDHDTTATSSATLCDSASNFGVELKNETQVVINDEDRLVSYSFISSNEKHYSEGFLNFLRRTGYPEQNLPKSLVNTCEKNRLKNESIKKNLNICPYVVSSKSVYKVKI